MRLAPSRAAFLIASILCLALSLSLAAASAPRTAAKENIAATPTPKPVDIVLFTIAVEKHLLLARMNTDGSNTLFLSQSRQSFVPFIPTDNLGDDWAAVPSPDGKWAAFYSNRTKATNMYLMEIGGASQRPLTHSDTNVTARELKVRGQISFSPDSSLLAYLSMGDIWVHHLDIDESESLTTGHNVKALAWASDGKSLAFVHNNSLFLLPLHSGISQMLLSDKVNWPALQFDPKDPQQILYFQNGAWTVSTKDKSRKRLFTSLVTPNSLQYSSGGSVCLLGESPEHVSEVFLVGGDGRAQQITRGGAQDCLFSSDGKKIFFLRQGQIWTIGVDSRGARPLNENRAFLPSTGAISEAK